MTVFLEPGKQSDKLGGLELVMEVETRKGHQVVAQRM